MAYPDDYVQHTLDGGILRPNSVKTVAPPFSTSLICGDKHLIYLIYTFRLIFDDIWQLIDSNYYTDTRLTD